MTIIELYEKNPSYVREAVDSEVNWMFSDAEEIGTSDVSCCVHNIISSFMVRDVSNEEFQFIRGMVRNAISMMSYN